MSMHSASGSLSGAVGLSIVPTLPQSGERGGEILKGRYRIERRAGAGAVTDFYLAFDLLQQRRCAIKMLRQGIDSRLEPRRRFEQEAAIVSRLSHPHIVEVYAFDHTAEGQPFLVMEMLRGRTLQDSLSEVGTLSWPRTLAILRPIAAALQYMHELDVLHPSIRPGAVFLHRERDSDGEQRAQVKLIDFGLARAPRFLGSSDPLSFVQDAIVGSPGYLPPESLQRGGVPRDGRADQWSLAVLAYRMAAGRLPFDAPNPYLLCALIRTTMPTPLHRLRPDLPVHVCEAIARAMSRAPEDRFARVDDFMRALNQEAARPAPRLERPARPEPPPTQQFDSSDLLQLCRLNQLPDEAIPEPINEGDSTSRYSESAPQRLLVQAVIDVPESMTKKEQAKAPAVLPSKAPPRVLHRRWLWAMGALLVLLSMVFGWALFAQGRLAKMLRSTAVEPRLRV